MIPARLDDSRPSYKRLHDLHWVDLFPNWEMGFGRLIRAMGLQPRKGREPDELDIYIRNNIDLAKFDWGEGWGDDYALVYVEYVGYDGLFVFWNERDRTAWYSMVKIRWSGPEKLTDQERARVWKIVSSLATY